MKGLNLTLALSSFLLASAMVLQAENRSEIKEDVKETYEDTKDYTGDKVDDMKDAVRDEKKDVKEGYRDAKANAGEKKAEYLERLQGKLDDLDAKIDELKTKASSMKGDSKNETYKKVGLLKKKRREVGKKFDKVKNASDSEWKRFKAGSEEAYNDLHRTYEDFKADIKD